MVKIPFSDLTEQQRDALKTIAAIGGGIVAVAGGFYGYLAFTKKSRAATKFLGRINAAKTQDELNSINDEINNATVKGDIDPGAVLSLQNAIVQRRAAIAAGKASPQVWAETPSTPCPCPRCGCQMTAAKVCPKCKFIASKAGNQFSFPVRLNDGL